MLQRERGSVKWFNDEKGCGFICRPENRGDAFITCADFRAGTSLTLADGQSVEYQPATGKLGIEAHDVTLLAD